MAKTAGRPSGGNKPKDPGDHKITKFNDEKLRTFFEDDEEGKQSSSSSNQKRVTCDPNAAGGIENDGTNDAIMTEACTTNKRKINEDSSNKESDASRQGEKMSDPKGNTSTDGRQAESRSTSDKMKGDASQSEATHLDINDRKDQDEGKRWVRLETFVKAGQKFSPVRMMGHLIQQIWESDELATIIGNEGRELCKGNKVPGNKDTFSKYFRMEKAEQSGGVHIGFAFQLQSSVTTEMMKQAGGMKTFLKDAEAWFNDQNEFISPLTCVAGWIAMVPPALAAHNPFVMTVQDCWIDHPKYHELLGSRRLLGMFPSMSMRVVKVYADPKSREEGSVWTLLVEVRCELEYVDAIVEIATTGDHHGKPCGLFISKEAANDVSFMTEIIQKHNKVNSNLVVIPMEGFSPTLLDAPATTLEGSSHWSMFEAILRMQALFDDEGERVQMQLFTGIYSRDDSKETGVVYITTTKRVAKLASRALDDDVIPMLMELPCYKNFGIDKQYGEQGIRRKDPRVIKSRNKHNEANKKYMERTRKSVENIDEHDDRKFNSFKQRAKRQAVPAEIVWTDDDPPVGTGSRSINSSITGGTSYREAIGSNARKRNNNRTQPSQAQESTKDDATASMGEGSGDVSAMTLATLYTTIDEQTMTIGNQQDEINSLKTRIQKQTEHSEAQEASWQRQQAYYESKLECVEKAYVRKLQVAEGNAALKAQQLERRLEEKWEKKLQSTIEELANRMANLQSGTAQYVTINASPSDSSSLTTRTRGQQSPESATVAASVETNGTNNNSETGGQAQAPTQGTGNLTLGKHGDNATAPTSNSMSSNETDRGTMSNNTTQGSMRSSAAETKRVEGKSSASNVSFGKSTCPPSMDHATNQTSKPKAPVASSLARATRPIVNPYLPKTSLNKNATNKEAIRPIKASQNTATRTNAMIQTPAPTTRPTDDAMDSETYDTSVKRNKDTSPDSKELTPTSHHTHKKSRGRHGSPVRKSAQTDQDRGCEPVGMELENERTSSINR